MLRNPEDLERSWPYLERSIELSLELSGFGALFQERSCTLGALFVSTGGGGGR